MAAQVPTFLVIGEALIDVVHRYAENSVEHVGGSPANVAVGVARLDCPTEFVTTLGDDARGERIRHHLERRGVTVVTPDGDHPTSTAQATIDEHGAATYVFDLHWDTGEIALGEQIAHIHTGSIGAVVPPGGAQVVDALGRGRAQATISYDPNYRPGIMGDIDVVRERMEQVIALADVVKGSSDDMALLYPDLSVEEALAHWGSLGPVLTIATLAADGVTFRLTANGETRSFPTIASEVVDTVGAGDSFMAGIISGLASLGFLGGPEARERLSRAEADDITPAIERGSRCAALTVSRAGAYAPSLDEL